MTALAPRPAAGVAGPARAMAAVPALDGAIVETLAYADVFDWPLTPAEVHRYLPVASTLETVEGVIRRAGRAARLIESAGGYAMLRGRSHLVPIRRRRERASAALWPRALAYGRLVARLPFVRLVAITGSLAVGACGEGDDVDLFVVTETGRVWLTRAMAMLVVRLAALRGLRLCPNYLLAESALALPDRSAFAAHELAQMVPIEPSPLYADLLAANSWHRAFLPNAVPHAPAGPAARSPSRLRAALETLLRSRPFDAVERWEMNRKARALRAATSSREVRYDASCCKGHADEHGRRIQAAYETRLRRLSEVM